MIGTILGAAAGAGAAWLAKSKEDSVAQCNATFDVTVTDDVNDRMQIGRHRDECVDSATSSLYMALGGGAALGALVGYFVTRE